MMDAIGTTTCKDNSKTGRRASFARALHVPSSFGRRVKHWEHPELIKVTPSSKPRTRDATQVSPPGLSMDVKLPAMALCTREVLLPDDGIGGADIPNISMRRQPKIRLTTSELGGVNSLATLERYLAAGVASDLLPPTRTNSFTSARSRAEKRYEAQCDGLTLSPVSELSWIPSFTESPEVDSSVETSLGLEMSLSPNSPFEGHEKLGGLCSMLKSSKILGPSTDMPPSSSSSIQAASPVRRDSDQPVHSVSVPSSSTSYVQTNTSTANQNGLLSVEDDSDPNNFELVVPKCAMHAYSLERRSELLFSAEHLQVIFSDPVFLHRFASFVALHRPQSMQLLNYTLDSLKAIRAMEYMNSIISHNLCLTGQNQQPPCYDNPLSQQQTLGDMTSLSGPELTTNVSLLRKTAAALQALARDELPIYVTHIWADIVESSMKKKITAIVPAKLQDSDEPLAESFVISDPSRADNPVVFASDEFHRTTHYGPDYVFGRNCRFLQGPKTNAHAKQRLHEMIHQGKVHYEIMLNYRRDGLPFMNLLMCTPLLDSMGHVRYFMGATIDVSQLAKDCVGLESLRRLADQDIVEQRRRQEQVDTGDSDFEHPSASPATAHQADYRGSSGRGKRAEIRLLAEMFDRNELEVVRRHGGRMHRPQQEQVQHTEPSANWHKPRVILFDDHEMTPATSPQEDKGCAAATAAATAPSPRQLEQTITDANGNISLTPRSPPPTPPLWSSAGGLRLELVSVARPPALFENHLVVRPYPSLRILFASPSLRVPGTLQSHLMSHIGGSRRIHEELEHAFAMGEGVTAKVKWVSGSGLRSNTGVSVSDKGGGGAAIPDNSSGSSHSGTAPLRRPETVGMEGRLRWIQCTPLFDANGDVGVWVVIIMEDDADRAGDESAARLRQYPDPSGGVKSQRHATVGLDREDNGEEVWSLADYAALSRLPENEDLRWHVKKMYEETRRRERGDDGHEWEKT